MHSHVVPALNPQQPIKRPTDLTPTVQIRRSPFMRIVGVLILMLSRLHRVVDHFTKSVAEFPEGLASQHSDLPRLRIDT